ncbi:hypothetical protein JST97_31550 [bacterium]|nr:hypothetical protein [bacterium]
MKFYVYLLAAALLGCSQSPPHAASQTPTASATPAPGGERGGRYRKMMEEIDSDHDGKLSDAEKKAGFDKMLEKSERFRERIDTDGDGKISDQEHKVGLENFMKRRRRHHRPDQETEPASPAPSDSETPE